MRVIGMGAAASHLSLSQMEDLTVSPAVRSGAAAFAAAGIQPSDVDVLQVYDAFTIMVLLTLEAFGFCQPGEGGAFVEDGKLAFDGALPTNTDGGGLSSNHPGMRGICCPRCWSDDTEWCEASGTGIVYTYSIVHQNPAPPFREQVLYGVVLIDLEEGVRVMANWDQSADLSELEVGAKVKVVFEKLTDEITLPRFRPATDS